MKILVVPNTDWVRAPVAGRMNFIFDCIAARHEVDVVHFRYDMFRDQQERTTQCALIDFGRLRSSNLAAEYVLHSPCHFAAFGRMLRRQRYDVAVLGNLLPAFMVSVLRGSTRCVVDLFDRFDESAKMHYVGQPLTSLVVGGMSRLLLARTLKAADCIVAIAEDDVDHIRSVTDNQTALHIIPNGIETTVFHPMDKYEAKSRLGLEGRIVIGFTGLLERWIDLDTVVELMPQLHERLGNVHLLIVGGSYYCTYADELRRKAYTLGLSDSVIMTGMVAYENVPLHVGAMDVCLNPRHPLTMNKGAVSNKLLGYLACGRPVLSTNNPAVERQFRHVHEYTRNTFVDALTVLLRELPSPNVVRAETQGYDWNEIAARFEEVLEETVRTNRSRSCPA